MSLPAFVKRFMNPFSWQHYVRRRIVLGQIGSFGTNFSFDARSTILRPGLLKVGNNVFIGEAAYISADVTIGDNVMMGPRVMIIGGNHLFGVKGKPARFLRPKTLENMSPIIIEDDVWCGSGVIILDGVTLGMGCVIGAGSVVAKSLPPFVVCVGNPSRPIRKIFCDSTLIEHLVMLGKHVSEAEKVVERRKEGLKEWQSENIDCIENTTTYWEYREEGVSKPG
jgi:acetyltransferase-like isoleucine patch superfamily enzyme